MDLLNKGARPGIYYYTMTPVNGGTQIAAIPRRDLFNENLRLPRGTHVVSAPYLVATGFFEELATSHNVPPDICQQNLERVTLMTCPEKADVVECALREELRRDHGYKSPDLDMLSIYFALLTRGSRPEVASAGKLAPGMFFN